MHGPLVVDFLVILWTLTVLVWSPPEQSGGTRSPRNVRFEQISLETAVPRPLSPALCRIGTASCGSHPGRSDRYDRLHFKVFSYDPEDPKSLSNNFVKTIHQDSIKD